jgi:flagellar biosynthesis/type III secretory pathway protein FliH
MTAWMFNLSNVKLSYGQTIQAGASRCIDRIGGVDRVQRGGVLQSSEAELNVTAQRYFEQQGPAEQLQNPTRAADLQAFEQAFQKGYTAGFNKTHRQR